MTCAALDSVGLFEGLPAERAGAERPIAPGGRARERRGERGEGTGVNSHSSTIPFILSDPPCIAARPSPAPADANDQNNRHHDGERRQPTEADRPDHAAVSRSGLVRARITASNAFSTSSSYSLVSTLSAACARRFPVRYGRRRRCPRFGLGIEFRLVANIAPRERPGYRLEGGGRDGDADHEKD